MTSIAAAIDFLKNITYYTFVISYNIGHVLIYCLSYAASYVNIIAKSIAALLKIVGEDFLIFLTEVLQAVLHVLSGALSLFENGVASFVWLIESIKYVFNLVLTTITATWGSIIDGFLRFFAGIGQLFSGIKQLLVLIGSGMWFAITLVPIFIVYFSTMVTYYFGCLLNEIYVAIKQFLANTVHSITGVFNFFVDVPLESLLGLVTIVCILYVVMKFHFTVYRFVMGYLQTARNYLLSYINVIRDKFSFPFGKMSTTSNSAGRTSTVCTDLEHYCTICQEQERCILFLPCKHVCLCLECNERLRAYNHTCPICRTGIKKSMKIYV